MERAVSRHIITPEERSLGHRNRSDAWKMRRAAEKALLDRMLAEQAMPEWYPHQ
jgi:hypothetical protein